MIETARARSVGEMFSFSDNWNYEIPRYQRHYTWSKSQRDQFMSDVEENGQGYFVGAIICINRTRDPMDPPHFEVVDGQQRLTTLGLIYTALYEKLHDIDDDDDEFITDRTNLKRRLARENQPRLRLSEQMNNHRDYTWILSQAGVIGSAPQPDYFGNRMIATAYRELQKKFREFDRAAVFDFLNIIDNLVAVKIDVNSHSDAFQLFESLNYRGMRLAPIDLIKNKLFSQLAADESVEDVDDILGEAFSQWQTILDRIPRGSDQARFLRQFYHAFRHEPEIGIEGVPRAKNSNIIAIFEEIIETDPALTLTRLVERAATYSRLIDPTSNLTDTHLQRAILSLNYISAVPAHILLLYLLDKNGGEFDDDASARIDLLTKFFVRRHITNKPETQKLDGIFIEIIEKIESGEMDEGVGSLREFLRDHRSLASDDELLMSLKTPIYDEAPEVTRYILSLIESNHRTRESEQDFMATERSRAAWQIEHILPQAEHLRDGWVSMLTRGVEDPHERRHKARGLQEMHVHRLGNLTLTRYNPELSDRSFEEKRDATQNGGEFVGFRNGLYLNRELAGKDAWTSEDIERRTDALAEEAVALLSLGE